MQALFGLAEHPVVGEGIGALGSYAVTYAFPKTGNYVVFADVTPGGDRGQVRVDPRHDRPHDEVLRRAGPLALRALLLRPGRQPARRHHGDERPHLVGVDHFVRARREVQTGDERRRLAPEAVQEVQTG